MAILFTSEISVNSRQIKTHIRNSTVQACTVCSEQKHDCSLLQFHLNPKRKVTQYSEKNEQPWLVIPVTDTKPPYSSDSSQTLLRILSWRKEFWIGFSCSESSVRQLTFEMVKTDGSIKNKLVCSPSSKTQLKLCQVINKFLLTNWNECNFHVASEFWECD